MLNIKDAAYLHVSYSIIWNDSNSKQPLLPYTHQFVLVEGHCTGLVLRTVRTDSM